MIFDVLNIEQIEHNVYKLTLPEKHTVIGIVETLVYLRVFSELIKIRDISKIERQGFVVLVNGDDWGIQLKNTENGNVVFYDFDRVNNSIVVEVEKPFLEVIDVLDLLYKLRVALRSIIKELI